jgi:hypothetical protein
MLIDMRERGKTALNQVRDEHLPAVVRWLELLAEMKAHPDIEPDELWLLATGELKKMDDEIEDAKLLDNWRKYLNDL